MIKLDDSDNKIDYFFNIDPALKIGGPGSGNFGHAGRPGLVGGSAPSKQGGALSSLRDLVISYLPFEFSKFVKENKELLKKAGLFEKEKAKKLWKESRYENSLQGAKSIPVEEAIKVIKDNIPENIRKGWFVNADSEYKPAIEELVIGNKELRNAGLNIAYLNYTETTKEKLSFDEFLNNQITVYRGGASSFIESDVFISYSFNEKIAEKFGKDIKSIQVIPKNTLGSFQTTVESEILVPVKEITKASKSLFHSLINSAFKIGGPGSGNFGHAGRPGLVGGSAPSKRGGLPHEEIIRNVGIRIDHSHLDNKVSVKLNEAVADFCNKYPRIKGAVQHIKVEKDDEEGVMSYYSFKEKLVVLNSDFFAGKSIQDLEKRHEYNMSRNFAPKNTDWTSLIYHELSHGLLRRVEFQHGKGKDVFKEIRNQSLKKAGVKVKDIGKNLSAYATLDPEEFIAESFGEFHTSSAPRELSKITVGTTLEYLNSGRSGFH